MEAHFVAFANKFQHTQQMATSASKLLIAKDSFTAQTRRGWIPAQGRDDEAREIIVQSVLHPLEYTPGSPSRTSDNMVAAAANARLIGIPSTRHPGLDPGSSHCASAR